MFFFLFFSPVVDGNTHGVSATNIGGNRDRMEGQREKVRYQTASLVFRAAGNPHAQSDHLRSPRLPVSAEAVTAAQGSALTLRTRKTTVIL